MKNSQKLLSLKTQGNVIIAVIAALAALIAGSLHIGPLGMHHIGVLGGLILCIVLAGGRIKKYKKNIVFMFFVLWLCEATISVLWAPDKALALTYTFYIFMIVALVYVLLTSLTANNIGYFVQFMVFVLTALIIVGMWEFFSGNHIKDTSNDIAGALGLRFVPRGFFGNPNDFATYIIMVLPFSLLVTASRRKWLKGFSYFNIVGGIIIIFLTQSRTQIIMVSIVLLGYLVVMIKNKPMMVLPILIIAVVGAYYILNSQQFSGVVQQGIASIQVAEILNSTQTGGSMGIRINLLLNGLWMLLDTFFFGCGAGCHRVLMSQYAVMHHDVGNVYVMHNILGEVFVDYGVVVGVAFVLMLIKTIKRLLSISRMCHSRETKIESILLVGVIGMFVICGISSSSLIQSVSQWTIFAYVAAFLNIHDEKMQLGREMGAVT